MFVTIKDATFKVEDVSYFKKEEKRANVGFISTLKVYFRSNPPLEISFYDPGGRDARDLAFEILNNQADAKKLSQLLTAMVVGEGHEQPGDR